MEAERAAPGPAPGGRREMLMKKTVACAAAALLCFAALFLAALPAAGTAGEAAQPCPLGGAHAFEGYIFNGADAHTGVCARCGEAFSFPCAFTEAVLAPTETEAGCTVRACAVCGGTLRVNETPPEKDRAESVFLGDWDRNGRVEAEDARLLLRVAVGLDAPEPAAIPYGDLNADETLGAADARLALRAAVGLDPEPERHAFEACVEAAPACTEPGALTYRCAYCGVSGKAEIPAAGHAFGEPEIKPPACTKAGSETAVCSVCGYRRVTALPATGHSFGKPTTVKPTCTGAGETAKTCRVCGAVERSVTPALGHQWIAATPKKAKHCARCGGIVAGWTQIGGYWYYFLANGKPATGRQTIDGKFYRFGANGVSQTGRAPAKPKVAVLGDSLVEALALSGVAKDYDFYGKVSLHAGNMATARRKSGRTVLDEVVGRNYDKVILLVGINDLGYADGPWGETYARVIRGVKSRAPGAEVIAHSILPVNNARARRNGYAVTMAQVNRKNAVIARIAAREKIRFLNATPALADGSGQLPYNAAGDGIHIGRACSKRWYDWIRARL